MLLASVARSHSPHTTTIRHNWQTWLSAVGSSAQVQRIQRIKETPTNPPPTSWQRNPIDRDRVSKRRRVLDSLDLTPTEQSRKKKPEFPLAAFHSFLSGHSFGQVSNGANHCTRTVDVGSIIDSDSIRLPTFRSIGVRCWSPIWTSSLNFVAHLSFCFCNRFIPLSNWLRY